MAPLSTFTLLDPETNINDAVAIDVIFVHGLRSKATASLRRDLKIWLREVQKSTGFRIWRFGFDGKELLTEGRQRLMVLAGDLLKAVQKMPGYSASKLREGETSKQERKLVFIGHGAAGWVIQAALAWYSTASTETARWTAMTIFLTLPLVKDQEDLDNYSEKSFHLYPGKEKSSLRYTDTMQYVQRNFKSLVSSSFGPVEKRVFISPPKDPVQTEGILRQETSATNGLNGSDSSQTSSILTAGQLSWEIQAKDKTDKEVRSLLESCNELKKSDRVIRKEQERLVYQPLAEKYGRTETKEFLGVGTQTPDSLRRILRGDSFDLPGQPSRGRRAHLTSDPIISRPSTALALSNPRSASRSNDTESNYGSLSDNESIAEIHETRIESERYLLEQEYHEQEQHKPEPHLVSASCSNDSSSPNPSDKLRQILRLAFSYQHSGEMRKAKGTYEYVIERLAIVPQLKDGIDAINCQIAITELYDGHIRKAQKVFTELVPKARATYDRQPQWSWEIDRWLAVSFSMQGAYKTSWNKLIDVNRKMNSFKIVSDVTLLTKSTLALVSGHLGRYKEALSGSEEVLQLAYDAVAKAEEAQKQKT